MFSKTDKCDRKLSKIGPLTSKTFFNKSWINTNDLLNINGLLNTNFIAVLSEIHTNNVFKLQTNPYCVCHEKKTLSFYGSKKCKHAA